MLHRYEYSETALLIAYAIPARFKQIVLVDMDSYGKIKSMLLTDPSEYIVESVNPRYPNLVRNEETCLSVIKECMDSGDCTPLLEFFTWDVVLNDGDDLHSGIYEVISFFASCLLMSKEKEVPLNIYLVMVSGHKNEQTRVKGRIGLALSVSDLVHYEMLLILHIVEGRIDKIDVLRDSDYILDELPLDYDICRHDCTTWLANPEQRTEEDWLNHLSSLLKGNDEGYFTFFFGTTPDCVLEDEVSGEVLKGRVDVTERIKELVQLNTSRSAEIILQMDGRMSVLAGGWKYQIETTKAGLMSMIRISKA